MQDPVADLGIMKGGGGVQQPNFYNQLVYEQLQLANYQYYDTAWQTRDIPYCAILTNTCYFQIRICTVYLVANKSLDSKRGSLAPFDPPAPLPLSATEITRNLIQPDDIMGSQQRANKGGPISMAVQSMYSVAFSRRYYRRGANASVLRPCFCTFSSIIS